MFDVVKELDDMGTQLDLMIAPQMDCSDVKPRLARLVASIKAKAPHGRMMMHSCGAISKIIGDLIDVGVEILNPVQYTAAGMDPADLKRRFGRHITFWGGGLETQRTLPTGSVPHVGDRSGLRHLPLTHADLGSRNQPLRILRTGRSARRIATIAPGFEPCRASPSSRSCSLRPFPRTVSRFPPGSRE